MAKMGSTVVMAVAAALAVAAVVMADALPPSAADASGALRVDTTPAEVAPTLPLHAATRVAIPTTVRTSRTARRLRRAFAEMVEHDGRPQRSCGRSVSTGVYRRPGAGPTSWVVTHRRVVLRYNRERRTFRFRAGCRLVRGTSGRGNTYQCRERYKPSWTAYCRRRQKTLLCAADERISGSAAAVPADKLPRIPDLCAASR